jgi:Domain of unknown function (DUF1994).
LVKEQLTEERARKTSLEQRGLAVITSSGTLAALLFGLTALVTKAQAFELPPPAALLLALAALLFVIAAVLGLAVNWTVFYIEVEPEGLRGLQAEDWAGDEAEAAKTVAAAWTEIIEGARPRNGSKANLLRGAILAELVAIAFVLAAVLVVLGLTGSSPVPSATGVPSPSNSTVSPPVATPGSSTASESLSGLLALLRVEPEIRDGYNRNLFKHWIDEDGDGCDTRREVLIIEAVVSPTVGPGCSLSGGEWLSLYDGATFTDARGLDIDHVVPLAEAWDSGASAWTADRRMRFANDLHVPWALAAVSASSNRSKGDRDPAKWIPPLGSFTCTYVAWWVEVKVRWSLTVDAAERDELGRYIAGCPGTPVSLVLAP